MKMIARQEGNLVDPALLELCYGNRIDDMTLAVYTEMIITAEIKLGVGLRHSAVCIIMLPSCFFHQYI